MSCKTWRIIDGMAESGDQNSNNNVHTELTMWLNIKKAPSILTVTYRISSEISDYFVIAINGRIALQKAGTMADWEKFEVDLQEAGRHCKWQLSVATSTISNVTNLCLTRNSFSSYIPDIHFNRTLSPYVLPATVANREGCNNSYELNDYPANTAGKLVMVRRGSCPFVQKVLAAQKAGARAVVIVDNNEVEYWEELHMIGDSTGMTIPTVMIGKHDGENIISAILKDPSTMLTVTAEDIEIGLTEITLMYAKDYTGSAGDDKVYIKEISVTGTKYAAEQCANCRPGFSSAVKSTECVPCPANSYADKYGTAWPCHPCGPHSYSAPGSTKCTVNQECGADDYLPRFTNCGDAGQRTLYYVPVFPPLCNYSNSTYTPPANLSIPCGDCSVGSVRDPVTHQCKRCPPGSASSGNGVCNQCLPGGIALKTLEYDGFNDLDGVLPPTWKVYCRHCIGDGWSLIPAMDTQTPNTYLSAGRHLGDTGFTLLRFPFTIEVSGNYSVKFDYQFDYDVQFPLDLNSVHVSFAVSSDGGLIPNSVAHVIPLPANLGGAPKTITMFSLQPGQYEASWFFAKWQQTDKPVSFVLRNLFIFGEVSGGAAKCDPCPMGYACANYSATICDPGSYTDEVNQVSCKSCTGNSVSFDVGATKCADCPIGTYGDPDTHSVCYVRRNSFMLLNNIRSRYLSYNLSFLKDRIGPISMVVNSSDSPYVMYIHLRTELDQFVGSAPLPCGDLNGPYACLDMNQPNSTYNMGNAITTIEPVVHDVLRDDLVIELQDGDRCNIRQNEFFRTTINLVCIDQNTWPTNKSFSYRLQKFDGCHAVVEIQSPLACPLCSSVGEIISAESNCNQDGKKRVFSYYNMTCTAGDYNTIQQTWQDCTFMDTIVKHHNAIGAAVIGIIFLVIILGVAVGYLYVSRKRIYSSYQRLAQGQSTEMGLQSPGTGLDLEDAEYNEAAAET
jgi:hypothetical protein